MKETTVQIDGMMSTFDDESVKKQIKHRDSVVKEEPTSCAARRPSPMTKRAQRRMTTEVLSPDAVPNGPAKF